MKNMTHSQIFRKAEAGFTLATIAGAVTAAGIIAYVVYAVLF